MNAFFTKIKNKFSQLSLRAKLTLLIGFALFFGSGIAIGIMYLLYAVIPGWSEKSLIWQMGVLCFAIAFLCSVFLSKTFFYPIEHLHKAMRAVTGGDLTTRITETTSAKELQQVFDGFNLMMDELSATETVQSDFIANVSHEFKTPINAIEGYATLLQNGNNDEETTKDLIDKILLNTQKLSPLISNILLLSKLENQHIPQTKAEYDLSEQIRKSILAFEGAWSAKDIEFDVEIEGVRYVGNEGIMSHVWSNLISNAIKFSPPSGQIFVRLYKEEKDVVFTIQDQGPGLSEETKKHLFDKFYQAETSHSTEGNGLGLALVKRILLLSNGDVTAENTEKGCKFTVTLHG